MHIIKLNSYPRIPNEIKPMIYVNGNMSDDSAAVLEHVYDAVDRLPEAESDAFNAVTILRAEILKRATRTESSQ